MQSRMHTVSASTRIELDSTSHHAAKSLGCMRWLTAGCLSSQVYQPMNRTSLRFDGKVTSATRRYAA